MSQLSDYRKAIRDLLTEADIEKSLIDGGMEPERAAKVAQSPAVAAQRSLNKRV